MTPRLYVDSSGTPAWRPGQQLDLPAAASRHAQVLRLQPGSPVQLFDGRGGQWTAEVVAMTRSQVAVTLGAHEPLERELPVAVSLAVCMPANDRMDDLIEKATELGAASLRPLMSERSVLRLEGERSLKKQAHWQAVAQAACEQCGRNRVPTVAPVGRLADLLNAPPMGIRWVLSLAPDAPPLMEAWKGLSSEAATHITLLSGPEGGLSGDETMRALLAGFQPISLGPRTLRADTAPLAALSALAAIMGSASTPVIPTSPITAPRADEHPNR